jgi:dipeptidase D
MQHKATIVLQAHLDMVHQKNDNTSFDFNKQGIEMLVDNGWVKAKGTTLGADNGIGVATIMALLASIDIEHPNIEALFTIDEETGMTGAKSLQPHWLSGNLMLNLDTEEDDEIDIGCAGGLDITATQTYMPESCPQNTITYIISVTGLLGGHSGIEIHKGLGNANKIMNRILFQMQTFGLQVAAIKGGNLRNAIPRESNAIVVVPKENCKSFENALNLLSSEIKNELNVVDPGLIITATITQNAENVMPVKVQNAFLKSIYAALNGVYCMSAAVPNLVETSNNIASVEVKQGSIKILCLTRSSSETGKKDLAQSLQCAFELMQAEVTFSGEYPGWQPNAQSALLNLVCQVYEKQNNQKVKVAACHAGLECGIIKSKYPLLDIISIGPTIRGAHSPNESVNIKSVQKFWNLIIEILKQSPNQSNFV